MNEQIKQLMGQTLDEKFAGTWSSMDMQDLAKFSERFAELIVRECADIAAKNQAENMNWDIAEIIKKHFGVEEWTVAK